MRSSTHFINSFRLSCATFVSRHTNSSTLTANISRQDSIFSNLSLNERRMSSTRDLIWVTCSRILSSSRCRASLSIEVGRIPTLTLNPAFAFAVGAKHAIKTRIVRSTRRNLGRLAARVALVWNMVWQTKTYVSIVVWNASNQNSGEGFGFWVRDRLAFSSTNSNWSEIVPIVAWGPTWFWGNSIGICTWLRGGAASAGGKGQINHERWWFRTH